MSGLAECLAASVSCCHRDRSYLEWSRFPASGSSRERFVPGGVAVDDPGPLATPSVTRWSKISSSSPVRSAPDCRTRRAAHRRLAPALLRDTRPKSDIRKRHQECEEGFWLRSGTHRLGYQPLLRGLVRLSST